MFLEVGAISSPSHFPTCVAWVDSLSVNRKINMLEIFLRWNVERVLEWNVENVERTLERAHVRRVVDAAVARRRRRALRRRDGQTPD